MINAIGNTVDESWNNCINGVSGIKEVRSIDTSDCYAHLGAESAEHFDVDAGDDAQKMDRVSLLCVKAANEAIKDSGIVIDDNNADRVGVIMGSCVGGAVSIQKFFTDRHNAEGSEDASDIIKMPIGVIANNVAKIAGVKGVVTNVGNACAASTISIEYACDLIRAGVGDALSLAVRIHSQHLLSADSRHSMHSIRIRVHHITRARELHSEKAQEHLSLNHMSTLLQEMRRFTAMYSAAESVPMHTISQHRDLTVKAR